MPLSVDQLVQRRIQQWEEQRRLAERTTARAQKPAVVISRTHGARGHAIGALVAQRLGLHLYDRDIVEQIAESAHVRAKVVESVDDRVRETITNWVGEQFEAGYFTYSDYLRHLTRVLLTITQQERCVIVGRGAQFVLDPARSLRVRAIAPLEVRIARIAEEYGLPAQEARARVLRMDTQRASFCRVHFAKDPTLAESYDLVINTGTFTVELCAETIERCYRARFG